MAPNSSVSSSSAGGGRGGGTIGDGTIPRSMSTPSPLHRLQTTHISFEELDDYVQLTQLTKWQYKLVIAFSDVVLASDMIVTLCQAIKQSIKRVDHDCQLHVELECKNSELSDDSFCRILAEASPSVMRKAGRVCVDRIEAGGNKIGLESVRELLQIVTLNKEAKYRYKFTHAITGLIDLSSNHLVGVDEIENLLENIGAPSMDNSPLILNLGGNYLGLSAVANWKNKPHFTIVGDDEASGDEDTAMTATTMNNCSRKKCIKNCWVHLVESTVLNQRDPKELEVEVETDPVEALSGYITPTREEVTLSGEQPGEASSGSAPITSPPSIQDMTKALLAGLKITPGQPSKVTTPDGASHVFPNKNRDPERTGNVVEQLMRAAAAASPPPQMSTGKIVEQIKSSEDISKSLLNLLHATSKAKEQAPTPPTGMTPNVMSLFSSAVGVSPGGPPSSLSGRGMSVSDIEANLIRNDRVSSPPCG